MTLLEALSNEAEHLDFKAAGIEALNRDNADHKDAVMRIRARARALREARERLREEMAKATIRAEGGIYWRGWHDCAEHINGGPGPAPRGPQPESPPDPVEAVLAVECPDCGCLPDNACEINSVGGSTEMVCLARIRAASRRDTP